MFTGLEHRAETYKETAERHLNWLERAAAEHGYESVEARSYKNRGRLQTQTGIRYGWKVPVYVSFDPDETGIRDFLDSFFDSLSDPFGYELVSEHYTYDLRNVPDDYREREYRLHD